ncbi:STAS domain-containing protein [Amycolatopsis sp. CA-128772]|uniref:STAS domain-containing protein n=1 Tax=Amycolatopsis sp. CA-128772 TaxID=2073159 RepID=UPI001E420A96|nr:STAS domain-containing protein [Amycolatopsis sp. CA-128772]
MTDVEGAGAAFSVQCVMLPEAVVVVAAGDLDMATAPVLRREALAAVADSPPGLIVDLAEVKFCGSAGLQVLSELVTSTADGGSAFAVVATQYAVLRALQVTRLDATLSVHPSIERARTWIKGTPDR